jgi:SPX domain protein involved in polyphosphate accumulation
LAVGSFSGSCKALPRSEQQGAIRALTRPRAILHVDQHRDLRIVAQGFVRSTTKYWVRTDHVSFVKTAVLQHLPVFQFDTDNFAGDAQLINSVYFDNQVSRLLRPYERSSVLAGKVSV